MRTLLVICIVASAINEGFSRRGGRPGGGGGGPPGGGGFPPGGQTGGGGPPGGGGFPPGGQTGGGGPPGGGGFPPGGQTGGGPPGGQTGGGGPGGGGFPPGGQTGGGPTGGGGFPPGGQTGGAGGGGVGGGAGAITGNGVSNSDSYTEEVVSKAVELIQSNTCGGMNDAQQCSGSCYGEVSSVYFSEVEGDYRLVVANGIPYHTANQGAVRPNPNSACENKAFMVVPANPTITGYTASGMGAIGISVTGGFIFNHLSNPTGVDDVAVINEGISMDSCDGHADPMCFYHYHDNPTCVADSSDCPLVGYLRDGFPIYGYCRINGVQLTSCYKLTSGDGASTSDYTFSASADCHLDENNGYTFSDGSYGYVITNSYPYTPTGYMGQDYGICYFS